LATSKKRDSVFISTASRDRAAARAERARAASKSGTRRAGTPASDNRRGGKPSSEARALAEARKVQREGRLAGERRAVRLRAAGVVAAVVLVIAGCVAIYNSSLFKIANIEVVGAVHVTAEKVRSLAAVPADATLIRFPADEVVARVKADPWVDSVTVSRVFPAGMRIRVTERVPVAVVNAGVAKWLIDGTGAIIATASVSASGSLPVIRDVPGLDLKPGRRTVSEPLLNAVAVLAGISRSLAAIVTAVSAPSIDGATLVTTGKVEIVIGQAADLAKKSELASIILREQKGKVVSIDVRVIDRPTWRGLK
jgi:cell division protein FtsQ